ncbi:MAG: 30S ribosomal protein S17 [Deltaproteobacteria bacterium]|nr:30S ribosomal protein S17 [Deltaproteobacteria bacterium]
MVVQKTVDDKKPLQKRRVLVGTVVSNKMKKTIVVKVDRSVKHGFYKKYITLSGRFKAHDEKNEAKPGDLVSIISSRPLSREKRWALREIIRRGNRLTVELDQQPLKDETVLIKQEAKNLETS